MCTASKHTQLRIMQLNNEGVCDTPPRHTPQSQGTPSQAIRGVHTSCFPRNSLAPRTPRKTAAGYPDDVWG
jgi:hypothetical protein